jgi:autotransporter-associated beta strand protein
MNQMKLNTPFKLIMAIALGAIAGTQPTFAGWHTWGGLANANLSYGGNWTFGGAPTNGEQNVYLYFPLGASTYTVSNNMNGLVISGIGISGDNYDITGNPLVFGGTNQPSITDSGNLNGFWAPVVLQTNITVNVSAGVNFYMNGAISGAGGLTTTGPGTLVFNGTDVNTYTGTTYVNSGTLMLARGAGWASAIAGPLVVGTGAGSPGTAIAKWFANSQVASTFPVTVNYTGVIDANDNVDSLGGLVLAGGQVQTGTGKFGIYQDVDVHAGASTINGNIWLYNATNCTFSTAPAGSLTINAVINAFKNSIGIVKTGAGSVTLNGANAFGGPVTVKQGYLSLGNNQALGQSTSLTVTNIGIVELFGVAISNVQATLSGNGNGNGSLRAFGTNIWSGEIVLTGNTGIQPLASNDVLSVVANIYGSGNLTKLGAGTLIFAGSSGNSYSGRTIVSQGVLQLSKSNAVAIPGPLIIGDPTNSVNSRVVKLTDANQIADIADVTVDVSGVLNFAGPFGAADTIGSLSGAGKVYLGFNSLGVGTNNADSTFSGSLYGFGASSFTKQGSGTMYMNGYCGSFVGSTIVRGGTLSVNGSMASSSHTVYSGATLAGNGTAGSVTASSGKIAPGNSPGLLNTANLSLGGSATLELELAGTNAGVDYDQVNVTGTVGLGGASLSVQVEFAGAVSNKYLVIKNDGNDAITGTFNGLPEGATFYASGSKFQITYHGGDGNDVELTQIALPGPSQVGSINHLGNGQIQLIGTGNPGMVYGIEANSDLSTSNWTNIGIVLTDQLGEISFTDTNAPNFPQRFYRLKAK